MVFNSYTFLFLFLPLSWLFWKIALRFHAKYHCPYLVIVSLTFYSLWDWHNLFVLLPSIVANFLAGELLHKYKKKWFLLLAVAMNLALIFAFKYHDFFLCLVTGASYNFQEAQDKIPLGISFFTFTQIAYLIDSYYHKTNPANLTKYALFVTYFPHLIAGPLLHHKEMTAQFVWPKDKHTHAINIAQGLCFLSFGLFKKVILADRLGLIADSFYTHFHPVSTSLQQVWSGIFAYAFQLYFDFSGYSDMAIGISLLFGVRLPINFNSPYKATSIIDFWHRWHMSLSNFLREYLYFPLGGSRKGFPRKLLNLMIVMVFCGLWHGAGIPFVVWGLFHGALLVLNHVMRHYKPYSYSHGLYTATKKAIIFYIICLGWVIFRSPTIDNALAIFKTAHSFSLGALPSSKDLFLITVSFVIVSCLPNTQEILGYIDARHLPKKNRFFHIKPNHLWAFVIALIAVVSIAKFQKVSPFLYFQF